jgi:hypothetical protein
MKGIVFTEFLELVEERYGLAVVDRMLQASDLPSGGVYTSVGTYHHNELVQLVRQLSAATGMALPDLLHTFGEYLFARFVVAYPRFFAGVSTAFQFLMHVENHIHVEVRKLYPEAELPRFECHSPAPDRLEMTYRSPRPFTDFAEGLIAGCIKHFGEHIDIAREDFPSAYGAAARFVLTRQERGSR